MSEIEMSPSGHEVHLDITSSYQGPEHGDLQGPEQGDLQDPDQGALEQGPKKGTRQDSEQGTLPCGNIYLRYALHASNNKAEYEKKKLNLNIMAMKYWLDCQETVDISICRIVGGVLYPLPL